MVMRTAVAALLASASHAYGLEDAASLVQVGNPSLKDIIGKIVDQAPAGSPQEGDESKPGFMGSLMRTLAAGAEADGDSSMSNFFNKAGNLAESLKSNSATPPPQATTGDHLAELGHNLEDWGKRTQNYFRKLDGAEEKQDSKIFSGIKDRIVQILPSEMRDKAAQLKNKAMKAKEQIGRIGSAIERFESNFSSAEAQESAKKRLEVLGNLVQERLKHGVNLESNNAKNLRKVFSFVKELKADDPEAQAASKNPLAGINELAAGIRYAAGRRPAKKADAPEAAEQAEEKPEPAPVQQPTPKPAAAAPQPVAVQPQMQPPLLPRVAPTQPPQQWAPVAQPVWQQAPPMAPMGYPMGAPPAMPQYPMGGMPQYPPQMR